MGEDYAVTIARQEAAIQVARDKIREAESRRRAARTRGLVALGAELTAGFAPDDPAGAWFSWASPEAMATARAINRIARRAGSAEALARLLRPLVGDESGAS